MKNIILVLVIALIVIGGGYLLLGKNKSGTNTQTPTESPVVESPVPTSGVGVTPTADLTPKSTTYHVSIQNFAFVQKSITIKRGDTVVWTNMDSAPHTITGGAGGPASGTLNNNGSYSFTFNTAGTFSYHCNFHPSMTGVVVVN